MSNENSTKIEGATDRVVSPIPTTPPSTNTAEAAPAQAPPPPGNAGLDAELEEIVDCLAKQLRQCQANSLGWLLRAGAYLLEVKLELESGEWTQLFASGRLPFGLRTAQTLARIADNAALSSAKNLSHLPTSISALDELARLDPALIEQGIREGNIQLEMTVATAKAFVRQHKQQQQQQQHS